MSDESNLGLFHEQVEEQPPAPIYLLTGTRQLLRLLDIGLIVPELVACNERKIFTVGKEGLSKLDAVKGYPAVPVILELKVDSADDWVVHPASAIQEIHFAKADDLEDYQARGFQNVPNGLFTFTISPKLFVPRDGPQTSACLSKIDRGELKENYRRYDVLAGLLWSYIAQSRDSSTVEVFLKSTADLSQVDDISAAFDNWVQSCIDSGLLNTDEGILLTSYLQLFSEQDIDEGWASAAMLEALAERLPESVKRLQTFQKWYRYCKNVIGNQKEIVTLTDEGDVSLRAILLHLLNPDSEAIERMALRDPAPGPRVLSIAASLAAARLGFAPLDASSKETFPGAYYLVSDLVAAFINKQIFELGSLQQATESAGSTILNWRGGLVNRFSASPTVATDTDSGIQEPTPPSFELTDIEQLTNSLHDVESVAISDGELKVTLTKVAAKPLPKQAAFSIMLSDDAAHFSSRLLNLSVKSQKAKLTGKRTLAALLYQTEQGKNFQFNTVEDDCFSAQVELAGPVDQQALQQALRSLLDCHAWMKTTIK